MRIHDDSMTSLAFWPLSCATFQNTAFWLGKRSHRGLRMSQENRSFWCCTAQPCQNLRSTHSSDLSWAVSKVSRGVHGVWRAISSKRSWFLLHFWGFDIIIKFFISDCSSITCYNGALVIRSLASDVLLQTSISFWRHTCLGWARHPAWAAVSHAESGR